MKQITLQKSKSNTTNWKDIPVLPSKDTVLINEDSIIHFEGSGVLPALYIKNVTDLPEFLIDAALSLKYSASIRAGELHSAEQKIFGLIPPSYQKEIMCMRSAVFEKHPEQYDIFEALGKRLSELYKEHLPSQYKLHTRLLSTHNEILPEYRLGATPFTSGILNKNNSLGYHKDQANITHSMSAMLVLRKGVAGGDLHLPDYNTLIKCDNNALFIFDGGCITHGVTNIIKRHPDAYRVSIVFYTLKAAKKCKTQSEEIKQAGLKYDVIAKRKQTIQEVKPKPVRTKRASTIRKQEVLLKALELNAGVVDSACEVSDISRDSYYRWLNRDNEFNAKVQEILPKVALFTKSKLYLGALENKRSETERLYRSNQKKIQGKN